MDRQDAHDDGPALSGDGPFVDDLLPVDVLVATAAVRDRTGQLIGKEGESIATAAEGRRHEYATGRVLARRLLTEMGLPEAPLLRAPDSRLPLWPAGSLGSITHSADRCIVAVARSQRYRGLGIDLEPDLPTRRDLGRTVLLDRELDWVGKEGEVESAERRRRTRVVFSIKEAVYKAFYPSTGRVWRFRDVCVSIDQSNRRFVAELPADAGVPTVTGTVIQRGGWIVSAVAVERS